MGDECETGDSARGQALFATRGCPACHVVRGLGTPVGPELTDIGLRRGAALLRESLLDPGAALHARFDAGTEYADYVVVRAVESGGRELRGVRLNEDTFTIQVRDAGGHVQ